MALVIINNIYKRKLALKFVHCFSFFTPSEHAVTFSVPKPETLQTGLTRQLSQFLRGSLCKGGRGDFQVETNASPKVPSSRELWIDLVTETSDFETEF